MDIVEQNAIAIADLLRAASLSQEGIAGVLGNFEAESGLYPCRMQGDFQSGFEKSKRYAASVMSGAITEQAYAKDGIGWGLAQWTYPPRKLNLLHYAQSKGKSIADLTVQVEFLINELNTDYIGVLSTLRVAADVREASNAMLLKFERPADMSESAQNYRYKLSLAWFNKLQNVTEADVPPKEEAPKTSSNEPKNADTERTPKWPPRALKIDALGSDVRLLQDLLYCHGYDVYPSGVFTQDTYRKLIRYQEISNLPVTGECDVGTWASLLGFE